MIQAALPQYQELERLLRNSQEEHAAKHPPLGTTHEEVGDLIASRWHFSNNTRTTIRYYPAPKQAPRSQLQASAVRIADLLRKLWKAGVGGQVQRLLQVEAMWRILASHAPTPFRADTAAFTVKQHLYDTAAMLKNLVVLE